MQAIREEKTEGEENSNDEEDADDVIALVVGMPEEIVEGKGHPDSEPNSYHGERFAGEGVAGSLADDDAQVHRPLYDDNVGKREREQKKNEEYRDTDPLRGSLSKVASAEDGYRKEEKQRSEPD